MKRRIVWSIVGTSLVALLVLGIPLGITIARLDRNEAVLRLEREASEARRTVNPAALGRGDRVELPQDGATRFSLYSRSGRRIAGAGPARADTPVRRALRGNVADARIGAATVVALPVDGNERVIAAIRASRPADIADDRIRMAWLVVGIVVGVALGVAGLIAWWQARRLTRPIDELVESAEQLGDGDFSTRTPRAGIAELDELGAAMDATAEHLGGLLARERAFSADASHQLRTPITALRVAVESELLTADPGSDAHVALGRLLDPIDRLATTVDELLDLARDTHSDRAPLEISGLLDALEADWHGRLADSGRPLRVETAADLAAPPVSSAAVRQILDVLVTNAWQHGTGVVTVRARNGPGALVVEVRDEGPGVTDPDAAFARRSGDGRGIGLSLARTLAEAEGGRLVLERPGPHPTFSLLIPTPTQ
ncbi:MAG: HAMP domain-containing sensor histidine kinase [Acidimicrobiia bacterium]